jgi:hypothetical protein
MLLFYVESDSVLLFEVHADKFQVEVIYKGKVM